jgi:hypothetical protein
VWQNNTLTVSLRDAWTGHASSWQARRSWWWIRYIAIHISSLAQHNAYHNAHRTTPRAPQHMWHDARRTTHDARRTTHDARRTTHDARRTTHDARRTTHDARRTTRTATKSKPARRTRSAPLLATAPFRGRFRCSPLAKYSTSSCNHPLLATTPRLATAARPHNPKPTQNCRRRHPPDA